VVATLRFFIFKTFIMSKFSEHNFKGQKALVRVDFNVPLNAEYVITDDNRMRATIPTIKKILADGGSVILMSHFGRPKDGPTEKYSLKHVVFHLVKLLDGATVKFADDCIGASAIDQAASLQPGEVLLLENLRFYRRCGFCRKTE
jgi:phosphoglycerate kinase